MRQKGDADRPWEMIARIGEVVYQNVINVLTNWNGLWKTWSVGIGWRGFLQRLFEAGKILLDSSQLGLLEAELIADF